MQNRRSFINTVTAAGALAGSAAVVAQTQTSPVAVSEFAGKSLPDLRQNLIASIPDDDPEVKKWLSRFSPSLDVRGIEALKKSGDQWMDYYASHDRSLFDPLLVESHLRSASALLDQCLAYRNELAGLEIAGFEAGNQYLASIQSVSIARQLIDVDADDVSVSLSKDKKMRVKLHRAQVVVAVNAVAAFRASLLQPGSVQNFPERFERLCTYYLEDLTEAYQRCLAASIGLVLRYGKGADVPVEFKLPLLRSTVNAKVLSDFLAPSGSPLDALVTWMRAAIRKMDQLTQDEFDFTVTFSMRQNLRRTQGSPAPTAPATMPGFEPLVSAQEWAAAIDVTGKGSLQFTVKAEDLRDQIVAEEFNLEQVRVLAVGVQYTLNPDHAVKNSAPIFQALVSPPPQKLPDDRVVVRRPLLVGRVEAAAMDSRGVPAILESDELVLNSPIIGKWDVRLRTTALSLNPDKARLQTTGPIARHSDLIADVLVTVRARARAVKV